MSDQPPPPPPSEGWQQPAPQPPPKKKGRGLVGVLVGVFLCGGLAIAALVIAVVAIGSGDDTATGNGGDGESGGNEVGQGGGSQDASDDVELTECGTNPDTGWGEATVTVTNNSSGRSDYFVTVAFESPDGAERFTEGIATAMDLDPDQVSEQTAMTAEEVPEEVECRVVEVQRTAASS